MILCLVSDDWQCKAERRLDARTRADENISAMQAHDVLDDREAEPGSAQRPAAGLVHAVEPLEQVRQMLLRDADAEVADGNCGPRRTARPIDRKLRDGF